MKAILGNFTKISETEFRLKKDLQFADITVDEDKKIQTVQYKDKQDIQIGDILTHQDVDYEILDINADTTKYLKVIVKANIQEQDVPEKKTFIARKMTPRKPKPAPKRVKKKVDTIKKAPITEKIVKEVETPPTKEPIVPTKAVPTTTIPKNRPIFKKILGWIGNKLTSISDR